MTRQIHNGVLLILATAIGMAFMLTWHGSMNNWPITLHLVPFVSGTLGSFYFWVSLLKYQEKYQFE